MTQNGVVPYAILGRYPDIYPRHPPGPQHFLPPGWILSSRKLHSGTFHCPRMDLAGTQDISFHSGTVPGNPGHLVTLGPAGSNDYNLLINYWDYSGSNDYSLVINYWDYYSDMIWLLVDVFQWQRPDADSDPDHGRCHPRAGTDPGRGCRHEGRLLYARKPGTPQPLPCCPVACLRRPICSIWSMYRI